MPKTCPGCGFTAADVRRSGTENPDSSVGVYAGCARCYATFPEIFDPIVEKQHVHAWSGPRGLEAGAPHPYVRSTRIRVARNFANTPFPAAMTPAHLRETLARVREVIAGEPELSEGGEFVELARLSPARAAELDAAHKLPHPEDRFMESAGFYTHWPIGRAVYQSADGLLGLWVNEEDGLRIFVLQPGDALHAVHARLKAALTIFRDELGFARDDRLGHLASCPSNVGTGMRASVHVRLPELGKDLGALEKRCATLGLAVRGTRGEHTEAEDSVFDISNHARWGLTADEIVTMVHEGVRELLAHEA
jgi:protein-arginine kinase